MSIYWMQLGRDLVLKNFWIVILYSSNNKKKFQTIYEYLLQAGVYYFQIIDWYSSMYSVTMMG